MVSRRRALRLLSLSGAAALLAAGGPAAPSAAPTAQAAVAPKPPSAAPAATQAPAAGQAQAAAKPAASGEQPKRGGNLTSTALPLARLDAHCAKTHPRMQSRGFQQTL